MTKDESQVLFDLIAGVYNCKKISFPDQTKEALLEAVQVIQENKNIDQALVLTYNTLKKFSAKERLEIPEVKHLTDFVQDFFYKHQGKKLRNFYTAYGAMSGPLIF
ncbi:hypothetical protein ACWOE5_07855 [Aerococcus sanguinicola]|nr:MULTISPECIES: hypothetical protein [Aerococcus]MDK7050611.1 hypothetical protein [Aerococcus sanguinicola]